MKTKQIIKMLVLLAVVIVIAILMQRKNDNGWREEDENTILSEEFETEQIAFITIEKGEKQLHFAKGNDGWTLAERGNYPVDMAQLGKIMLDLTTTRIAQLYQPDTEMAEQLMLTPEAGATILQLMDDKKQTLAKLCFGKRVEKEADEATMAALYGRAAGIPLGRYLQLQSGAQALVANTFSILENEPGEWLQPDFFSIKTMKSAVLYLDGKEEWSLLRQDNKLTLQGNLPAGYAVDSSSISAIERAFNWFPFKDALPNDKPLNSSKKLVVTDEDGYSYVLFIGEKSQDGRCIRVTAEWNGADDNAEAKSKVAKMNERMNKYDYIMMQNALDDVDKTRKQLLKEEKPSAPADKKSEK